MSKPATAYVSAENKRTQRKLMINATIRYGILILIGFILAYPLIWMVASSFQNNIDILGNASLFPVNTGVWTTEHYGSAWNISAWNNMAFYYLNTLRFLIPRVIGTVVSCTITAYAIGRFNFPGKKLIFMIVLVTLMMPDLAFRIPVFLLFSEWGLIDTFMSLWLQESLATSSFFVFMIIQFMRTIPRELDEAAQIDGCNPLQILLMILLPILRPVIITVALLSFMWGMNDFQGPLIFLNSPENLVLAQALRFLMSPDATIMFASVFAGAFMGMIPTLAIFFAASRYFVEGVAASGGKE